MVDVHEVGPRAVDDALEELVDALVAIDAGERREIGEAVVQPPSREPVLPPLVERIVRLRRIRRPGEHPDRVPGSERRGEVVGVQLDPPDPVGDETVHHEEDPHQLARTRRSIHDQGGRAGPFECAPRYCAAVCARVQGTAYRRQ